MDGKLTRLSRFFGLGLHGDGVIGASLSEPHISESNGGFFIGASVSEPHIVSKTKNCLYVYMYIYIYIWYVRIPYMQSALFVRDACNISTVMFSCRKI